ncbi:MAG: preQ(1) synthase [Alphaproteobacteria bacterium]
MSEGATSSKNGDSLTQLGQHVAQPASPHEAKLERVSNPHPGSSYVIRLPDFAHLVIDYVPGDYIVESKSLKLYLTSFRNHGSFHEACTLDVGKRLVECVAPQWLRIGGYWYPRGGIPIDIFWQTGVPPEGVWLPDQGVAPYRGRG